jgi:hypothetical protein
MYIVHYCEAPSPHRLRLRPTGRERPGASRPWGRSVTQTARWPACMSVWRPRVNRPKPRASVHSSPDRFNTSPVTSIRTSRFSVHIESCNDALWNRAGTHVRCAWRGFADRLRCCLKRLCECTIPGRGCRHVGAPACNRQGSACKVRTLCRAGQFFVAARSSAWPARAFAGVSAATLIRAV